MSIFHNSQPNSIENAGGSGLTFKWEAKVDQTNKMLLSEPKIIDLVVRALLGVDIPDDSYNLFQNEYSTLTGSYTLYTSQNTDIDTLVPVLVFIQEEVNEISMLEIIERSTLVYQEFGILPIVLVIFKKSTSELKSHFGAVNGSFLLQCKAKFWANKCLLFFPDDLANTSITDTTSSHTFYTLLRFISNPNKSFTLSHNPGSQTVYLTCESTIN